MGFCFAEAPDRPFNHAEILWSADVDPAVLTLIAKPARAGPASAIDLLTLADQITLVEGQGCRHLLLRKGGYALRIDLLVGSVDEGPIILQPMLDVPAHPAQLETLVRLMALAGVRGIGKWRLRPDARMQPLTEALRAADGAACDASLREIAVVVFGEARASAWPGANGSLKSRLRRRVALGRQMIAAGPAAILRRF